VCTTNTKVNSAFHPFEVGKSSADLPGFGQVGAYSPVSVADSSVITCLLMLSNTQMGFYEVLACYSEGSLCRYALEWWG